MRPLKVDSTVSDHSSIGMICKRDVSFSELIVSGSCHPWDLSDKGHMIQGKNIQGHIVMASVYYKHRMCSSGLIFKKTISFLALLELN